MTGMTEGLLETEVDRTKSRWVARVLAEFGRPRTTARALFYYALSREEADYPICGGFVGEIRVTRPYHVSDGSRLEKWLDRARHFGYVDHQAILEEAFGEQIYMPEEDEVLSHIPDHTELISHSDPSSPRTCQPCRLELWLDRSALNPLLYPLCREMGITLVSVERVPSREAVQAFLSRCAPRTVILCLSDLSLESFAFERTVAQAVGVPAHLVGSDLEGWGIQVRRLGFTPRQVLDLKLPLVPGRQGSREAQNAYQSYVKPKGISSRTMSELDALEVHYPGGLAGFVRDELTPIVQEINQECESARQ